MYTDKDGRLVKVEGDPDNPYNQGRLCCRCLALTEAIYDEGRLLHPMKRDSQFRGQADKWERITWDEAFDVIEEKFKRYRDEFDAESVSFWKWTPVEKWLRCKTKHSEALLSNALCRVLCIERNHVVSPVEPTWVTISKQQANDGCIGNVR